MYVLPREGDSPEALALKKGISKSWERTLRLKKALDASMATEGLFRGRLRLLEENLTEGQLITHRNVSGEHRGIVELDPKYPYLWLRLVNKEGQPSQRRIRYEEPMGKVSGFNEN